VAKPVAVSVEHVTKTYPGVDALIDVSLEFQLGEVVAICGANGAGKSTLAKLISGVEPATSGMIRVGDGKPVRRLDDAFAAGVLMLHQEPLVVDDFTLEENLRLYDLRAQHGARSGKAQRPPAGEVLARVGLGDVPLSTLGRALAPGQRQMLALGRALVYDHQVLILDETTASATESYFQLVQEVVASEKAAGRCVIFVSHRMQEVFGLADRIVVLRNGQFIGEREVAATDTGEITQMMIGESLAVLDRPEKHIEGDPVVAVSGLAAGSARDISFEVRPGEVLGIYGLVGSGRSSVIRSLSGRQTRRAGKVQINGVPSYPKSPTEAMRQGIAYLSEDRHRDGFVPDFTNRANLTMCCLPKYTRRGVISTKREASLAKDLVDRFAIVGGTESLTSSLSGGNQQKVCVARWIAAEPEVYLLDEPTKGVDVGARARIYEIVYNLAALGKAIVVISSEADEVLLLADRVLVMREGRVILDRKTAGLTSDVLAKAALSEGKV
jgi:ABC-type sugar transport system ATPase subunit